MNTEPGTRPVHVVAFELPNGRTRSVRVVAVRSASR
jgi:hypothetical protein